MIKKLRLAWEPENLTPLSDIEGRMLEYFSGTTSGVTLFDNGTILTSSRDGNVENDAKVAMDEAKYLIDFKSSKLKEGGYLVTFHRVLGVFVGDEEFRKMKPEIIRRLDDLKFPEEVFLGGSGDNNDLYVGLYARGKLQRDAHNPKIYKRILED